MCVKKKYYWESKHQNKKYSKTKNRRIFLCDIFFKKINFFRKDDRIGICFCFRTFEEKWRFFIFTQGDRVSKFGLSLSESIGKILDNFIFFSYSFLRSLIQGNIIRSLCIWYSWYLSNLLAWDNLMFFLWWIIDDNVLFIRPIRISRTYQFHILLMKKHLLPDPLGTDAPSRDMTIYCTSRYWEASGSLDTINSESHNNKNMLVKWNYCMKKGREDKFPLKITFINNQNISYRNILIIW